jgi:hypothetical protein
VTALAITLLLLVAVCAALVAGWAAFAGEVRVREGVSRG